MTKHLNQEKYMQAQSKIVIYLKHIIQKTISLCNYEFCDQHPIKTNKAGIKLNEMGLIDNKPANYSL